MRVIIDVDGVSREEMRQVVTEAVLVLSNPVYDYLFMELEYTPLNQVIDAIDNHINSEIPFDSPLDDLEFEELDLDMVDA